MTKSNKGCHNKHGASAQQRGIALIEAMVALLIVSFGALGLVGMHLFLNRNADLAKQRSEAVRLAQADMENMRVYRTMGPSSAPLYWTNVIQAASTPVSTETGINSYTSNTSYTLTRSVVNSSTANYKQIQVNVAWADRAGANQAIVFRSIVNGTDPSTAVSLSIAPNGSPVRDTLGRNVSIPIPSKNLGDGTSAFKPRSDGTTLVVFDNTTGLIKKICTITSTTQSAQITTSDLTSCTEKNAYLLSGFIRFKTGRFNTNFDPVTANDQVPAGTTWNVGMTMNDVAPLPGSALPAQKHGLLSLLSKNSAAWTTAISNTLYPSAPACAAESLKTIKFTAAVNYSFTNNGSTTSTTSTTVYLTIPASVPLTAAAIAPYTTHTNISNITDLVSNTSPPAGEYYVGYSCVIEPIDLDNDTTTPKAWTGLLKLSATGASLNTTSTTSTTYKVCRFSADYNISYKPYKPSPPYPANTPNPFSPSNYAIWYPVSPAPDDAGAENVDRIDNEEHPYAYLNVQRSLSNQNFLVIKGNESCPSGSSVEVNGTGSEVYKSTTTVLHQP